MGDRSQLGSAEPESVYPARITPSEHPTKTQEALGDIRFSSKELPHSRAGNGPTGDGGHGASDGRTRAYVDIDLATA
jgi:hypothetical protein